MPRTNRERYTLEELTEIVLENSHGPKVVQELGVHLRLDEAESLCVELERHGLRVEPYDFPSTINVWKPSFQSGVSYAQCATKQLIITLGGKQGIDYRTFDGFKQMLPLFTGRNFKEIEINTWGTTLESMLVHAYESSPSAAILDLVYSEDSDFKEIREHNLQAYDFQKAPARTWVDEEGKATATARRATKRLLVVIAKELRVDYTTDEGFEKVLPALSANVFNSKQINEWGTTLNGMIVAAYGTNISSAILDVVMHDAELNQGLEIARRYYGEKEYCYYRHHYLKNVVDLEALAQKQWYEISPRGFEERDTTPEEDEALRRTGELLYDSKSEWYFVTVEAYKKLMGFHPKKIGHIGRISFERVKPVLEQWAYEFTLYDAPTALSA